MSKKKNLKLIGVIVKSRFNLPSATFDAGVPAGSIGIVTELNSDGDPVVEFEAGSHSLRRGTLMHWDWLEVIG